ncbi:hypothetical protein BDV98DRAFT_509975, partial [Pterulicium gracile]
VYLPAIVGIVPENMIKAFPAFFDFCYIARCNAIPTDTLEELEDALQRFHQYCSVFAGANLLLPQQHLMSHYPAGIRLFVTPYAAGTFLLSYLHYHSVKKPWRRSNRYEALPKMLLIQQRQQ